MGYAVGRLCSVVVLSAVAEGGGWQHQQGRPAARRYQEQWGHFLVQEIRRNVSYCTKSDYKYSSPLQNPITP